MKTTRRRFSSTAFLPYALMLLALFLFQPANVMAQWTMPNINQNITNTNTGNVGIGTLNPAYKLDVMGSINTAAALCLSGDCKSSWSQVGSKWTLGTGGSIYYLMGNVGVGTSAPNYRFQVLGSSSRNILALTGDGDAVGYAGLTIQALTTTGIATNRTSNFNLHMRKDNWYGGDGSGPSFIIETVSKTGGFAAPFLITPNNDVILNGGVGASGLSYGNVGIGTTSPGYKLDINGNLNVRGGTTFFRQSSGLAGGEGASLSIGATANNEAGLSLNVYRAGVYTPRFAVDTFGRIALQPNGDANVGIGTSAPNYRLDVQGGAVNASGGLCIAGDCKTAWSQVGGGVPSQWTTAGSNIHFTTGNVGIGIPSPTSPLFIAGNEPSTDYATLRVKPTVTHGGILIDSANNASQVHLRFFKSGVPKWQIRVPFQDGVEDFRLYSWAAASDVLSITPLGNVGIGTTSPTSKLHVVGDITVTGNINAKYQDLAEWVPAIHALSAGTVAVLNPNQSNQVMASTQAYDTRVAGVISERPGIVLGESGSDKVLVATTGRVRVKVDATRAPIHIGDLLVASEKEGMAMKSQPINIGGVQIHRPGTLIGKALEPLEKGQGEILVLLSLQ